MEEVRKPLPSLVDKIKPVQPIKRNKNAIFHMRIMDEEDEISKAIGLAMEKMRKEYPGVFNKRVTIPCPRCGKNLHMVRSSYNGHIWGECETKGCMTWYQ